MGIATFEDDRAVSIRERAGRVLLDVQGRSGVTVSPEDFAREVNAAGIPGLTVTYEKPAPPTVLPTEPGPYIDREGDVWFIERAGYPLRLASSRTHRGGLYPYSDADVGEPEKYAPFTRLIPENESDV